MAGKKSIFFDDDLGDDFLSSWKPSKLTADDDLDLENIRSSGLRKVKKFTSPKLDMDFDFDSRFSKLSSFDIDISGLDFNSPCPPHKIKNSDQKKAKDDDCDLGFNFKRFDNLELDDPFAKKFDSPGRWTSSSDGKKVSESVPEVTLDKLDGDHELLEEVRELQTRSKQAGVNVPIEAQMVTTSPDRGQSEKLSEINPTFTECSNAVQLNSTSEQHPASRRSPNTETGKVCESLKLDCRSRLPHSFQRAIDGHPAHPWNPSSDCFETEDDSEADLHVASFHVEDCGKQNAVTETRKELAEFKRRDSDYVAVDSPESKGDKTFSLSRGKQNEKSQQGIISTPMLIGTKETVQSHKRVGEAQRDSGKPTSVHEVEADGEGNISVVETDDIDETFLRIPHEQTNRATQRKQNMPGAENEAEIHPHCTVDVNGSAQHQLSDNLAPIVKVKEDYEGQLAAATPSTVRSLVGCQVNVSSTKQESEDPNDDLNGLKTVLKMKFSQTVVPEEAGDGSMVNLHELPARDVVSATKNQRRGHVPECENSKSLSLKDFNASTVTSQGTLTSGNSLTKIKEDMLCKRSAGPPLQSTSKSLHNANQSSSSAPAEQGVSADTRETPTFGKHNLRKPMSRIPGAEQSEAPNLSVHPNVLLPSRPSSNFITTSGLRPTDNSVREIALKRASTSPSSKQPQKRTHLQSTEKFSNTIISNKASGSSEFVGKKTSEKKRNSLHDDSVLVNPSPTSVELYSLPLHCAAQRQKEVAAFEFQAKIPEDSQEVGTACEGEDKQHNCVSPREIPTTVQTESPLDLIRIDRGDIVEQAEKYSDKLEAILRVLKKLKGEAKDLVVRALVNNNKLLILNSPMNEDNIRKKKTSILEVLGVNSNLQQLS